MRTTMKKVILSHFAVPLLALTPAVEGCVALDSDLGDAVEGCPELSTTTIDGNLQVDADVRAFMQASADFRVIGEETMARVKTACVGIATDLDAPDTWSALGDGNDSISNADGTGACDAASVRISAIMRASATANFALVTVPGACHADFQAQTECDTKCSAQAVCDPGTVETRCTPGELSMQCTEMCRAGSWCGSWSARAPTH